MSSQMTAASASLTSMVDAGDSTRLCLNKRKRRESKGVAAQRALTIVARDCCPASGVTLRGDTWLGLTAADNEKHNSKSGTCASDWTRKHAELMTSGAVRFRTHDYATCSQSQTREFPKRFVQHDSRIQGYSQALRQVWGLGSPRHRTRGAGEVVWEKCEGGAVGRLTNVEIINCLCNVKLVGFPIWRGPMTTMAVALDRNLFSAYYSSIATWSPRITA